MAQSGSALATSAKAFRDCGNQKLCSMATARLNAGWTSALQETGKFTLPSFSASSAAATPDRPRVAQQPESVIATKTSLRVFISVLLFACYRGDSKVGYRQQIRQLAIETAHVCHFPRN